MFPFSSIVALGVNRLVPSKSLIPIAMPDDTFKPWSIYTRPQNFTCVAVADSHMGLRKYTEFESRLRSVIPGGGAQILVMSVRIAKSDVGSSSGCLVDKPLSTYTNDASESNCACTHAASWNHRRVH